jgi:hypothetical protein
MKTLIKSTFVLTLMLGMLNIGLGNTAFAKNANIVKNNKGT